MSVELIGVLLAIVIAYSIGKAVGRGQGREDAAEVRLALIIEGNPVDGFVMVDLREQPATYPTTNEETLP